MEFVRIGALGQDVAPMKPFHPDTLSALALENSAQFFGLR